MKYVVFAAACTVLFLLFTGCEAQEVHGKVGLAVMFDRGRRLGIGDWRLGIGRHCRTPHFIQFHKFSRFP